MIYKDRQLLSALILASWICVLPATVGAIAFALGGFSGFWFLIFLFYLSIILFYKLK